MNIFNDLMIRLVKAFDVPDINIPVAGVRIFKKHENIPEEIMKYQPDGIAITSCHSIRTTMMGDAVYLTVQSIGCIAAAISLGLVDKYQSSPLKGQREYIEIMKRSSGKGDSFIPPSPLEFADGTVYAFKDSKKDHFALFGKDDSGRYVTKSIARKALSDMLSLQPPTTQGVFYFSPDFEEIEIIPDVVILSLRPVELCRLIQGYQYLTGNRVKANVGGLRAGCSDLIVRPYLLKEINFSPYCLGARLIAKFEGDRLGMGFPFSLLEIIVKGTEASKTGFPFPEYPDACL
ncbi:DUF169 domain-containing protein [Desulfobacterium sp. N47]|uniref:Uncharacterized protein n=1 Tax=uncultured Desulfobacterium sp. TaxID=201089 RepID=E1YD02_9BACT|nr:hypothetical protein N47_G37700 [uncultured Desulfobacterium sp.]